MTAAPTPRSGHWASMGESTFVLGLWFLVAVHRVLGRVPFLLFLYPVVFYYWATRGAARRASFDYLQRLQTAHGALGHAPTWRDGLRHFLSFADTILDKTLALSGRYRFAGLRFVGREPVRALIDRGQGAVLVTAHMGCLEMIQAAADQIPRLKLNVLVHTAHAAQFNRVLARLDPLRSVRLIHVSEITPATAVMLAERMALGEFVAIAGDRVPLGSGKVVRLPFLGAPAAFPVGSVVLAALLKCPLFFVGCVRERQGHAVYFEQLADAVVLPRKDRDAALAAVVQRYVQCLEDRLQAAPFEWFNFFPFWQQGPAPAPAPTPSSDTPAA
jgi:predicted LPLAT superfamily acyltransferase